MDLPLRTISYIADIGNMVVLMARGKMVRSRSAQENLDHTAEQTTMTQDDRRLYRMICHVFESEDVSYCYRNSLDLVSTSNVNSKNNTAAVTADRFNERMGVGERMDGEVVLSGLSRIFGISVQSGGV